jgi:hypothetical protein
MYNNIKTANLNNRPFVQMIYLTVLALIVHAIVLKFIFPGYYSPLYPHHSDFYISVALAHSPGDYFLYNYPRPVGLFFLKIIGSLGIHGAILFTIINVAVNCSLTAILFRHLLSIKFRWQFILAFFCYCFLLFSQSYFYTFYTHDVFSHLSYFFLIAGALLFYKFHTRHKAFGYISLFFFSGIAFLCKETYALTALLIAFIWMIYYKKKSLSMAISPLLTITGTLLLVLIFNVSIKSVFVNYENNSISDPYYVNLSLLSICNELYRYAGEGLNFINWMLIAMVLFLGFLHFRDRDKKVSYILIGCFVAAFLSWIPNALIPNHHNGGYSFNGAYLLYLPLLSIPFLGTQGKFFQLLRIGLLISCIISPLFNKKEYSKQWWVLEQENTQRNLLNSLGSLMKELKPTSGYSEYILITGLRMPFYPFHHPQSLKDYPNSKFAMYDVVNYSLTAKAERDNLVKFIRPADVKIGDYTAIWIFADNGSMLRKLTMTPAIAAAIIKNNYQDIVIYPDSTKNQKLSSLLK